MKIEYRVLKPGDEVVLEAFLLPQIATSMFLLGNMRQSGLTDNGRSYTGTYAAAFAGDTIVGAAALFWNGNLVVQSPLDYLADLWQTAVSPGSVQSVSASKRALHGIIGPAAQVQFVFNLLKIEPALVQVDEVENLYSLNLADLRVPEGLGNGRLQGRRAETDDLGCLSQWRVAYMIEAMAAEDSPELRQSSRLNLINSMHEGRVWILTENGIPVAMTGFNTAITEAVQVGGVYTPPAKRGNGYARAVVAASLLDARSEGVKTGILFTGIENIPAQKAYTALGFQHIGDYRILQLKRPFTPS